ncbi:MAG: alpha/beta fold hydrolase [Frankiales bacterium]|nr:alpha/beta fold hydrolase [Frankiales bacterium]
MTVLAAQSARVRTQREARGTVPGDGITMAFGYWPGTGAPVVGLHGITASYVNFVGVAAELAGRRPLLALDLRGRGDTDKPASGPFGMAQHAEDVAAAMRGFGLGRSVVVGHSMGAYVAVALAAAHPDLVSALVLVDGGLPLQAPPGIAPEQMLDIALAPQMARLQATFPTVEAYLDYWRAMPPFEGGRWNEWVEDYLRYDLGGTAPSYQPKASEAAVRGDFLDSLDADVLRARLASLRMPVLLLRAAEGFNPGQPPLLPDDLVAREGGLVADLTERVVPDTTHYTIALGRDGARVVADAIADIAETHGR